MNFLVTGGAGFIGSHLVEELLNLNHRVVVVDNFHDFYHENLKIRNILEVIKCENQDKYRYFYEDIFNKEEKINMLKNLSLSKNFELEYCDIRDFSSLETIFRNNSLDCIINLAGLAGVRPSLEQPMEYEDVNIKGYMNLLELTKKYSVKKFIQASSSSVYGNNKKIPFNENDMVDHAISPYAGTKKACEVMGHVYSSLYGIGMIQLRFFTVYGPRQRPDLAIYKFTEKIINNEYISMFGDGNTFRDYTYVKDIVDGIIKSIAYLNENSNSYEIINLGESHTVSLKELVEELEKKLKKKALIERKPMQPGDVEKTYADISKAKKLIGYNPTTNFSQGIELFIKWFKNNKQN